MDNGSRSKRMPQSVALRLIQGGETYVYALVTRDGAIKIGVTKSLAVRKTHMAFGGFDRFLAFMPGDYDDEQAIHTALPDDLRLPDRREYYYPMYEQLLPHVNRMREAMGVKPLNRRDLPRTGHWARRLPQPEGSVSWPWPQMWAS